MPGQGSQPRKTRGMSEEESEYRIYISSRGGAPVVRDIVGEEQLARHIAEVRTAYPTDTIYVREVFETVKAVLRPKARVIRMKKRSRQ